MKSFIPFLLLLLVLGACKSTSNLSDENGGNKESTRPVGRVLEGFDSPESILLTRTDMFVSNVGPELAPQEEDSDGYISKLSPEGEMQMERFITELNAPKGMAEIGGMLFVADINKVKSFKTENGEPAQEYELIGYGARFLNDIVAISSEELLISDSELNLIFSLNVKTGKVGKMGVPDNLVGLNGLAYDPTTQFLFMVGFGANGEPNGGVAIMYPSDDPKRGPGLIEILDTPKGFLDGVAFIEGKYVVFSDWSDGEGKLRYYDVNSKETWLINLEHKIMGPADFAFDAARKCLWIPAMQEGKIYQEFLDFY